MIWAGRMSLILINHSVIMRLNFLSMYSEFNISQTKRENPAEREADKYTYFNKILASFNAKKT